VTLRGCALAAVLALAAAVDAAAQGAPVPRLVWDRARRTMVFGAGSSASPSPADSVWFEWSWPEDGPPSDQLFAAEPDIVKPIYLAWDERGRA